MRNLILAGALGLLVLSPLTAAAQQRAAPAAPPSAPLPAQAAAPSTAQGVSTNKLLAIGVGVVLGAVAAEAIVTGEGIVLIGGVAGGLLATWWYEVGSGMPIRAAMREPDGAPVLARAERLVLTR